MVELEGRFDPAKQLLLESEDLGYDVQMEQILLTPLEGGTYQVIIENCIGFTQTLDKGAALGTTTEIEEIIPITCRKGEHKLISWCPM